MDPHKWAYACPPCAPVSSIRLLRPPIFLRTSSSPIPIWIDLQVASRLLSTPSQPKQAEQSSPSNPATTRMLGRLSELGQTTRARLPGRCSISMDNIARISSALCMTASTPPSDVVSTTEFHSAAPRSMRLPRMSAHTIVAPHASCFILVQLIRYPRVPWTPA